MKKTLVSLASVALLLAACSRSAPPEEPIRAVKVMSVGTSTYAASHEYAGEVRAQVESRLGFRVGGKLIKRQAELGQHVNAGQVLAQLDPQDYRLAADAARAQVAVAATNRNLAAADFKRYQALKDQNFISGAELERRDATLKAAQAQLQQAQSQLAVQGAPVVRIAADGVRDVVFSVPEDKVAGLKVGAPVRIRVWAQDAVLQGRVREVAASSDPVTRTYPVKVSIDSKAAPPLGATVYVIPEASAVMGTPVIKLPTSALRQDGPTTTVWVLDKASMTVSSQPIQIATADGNDVVVASGLTPGMLVVSAGVHVLSPGQKVSIYASNRPVAQDGRAQPAPDSIAKHQPGRHAFRALQFVALGAGASGADALFAGGADRAGLCGLFPARPG